MSGQILNMAHVSSFLVLAYLFHLYLGEGAHTHLNFCACSCQAQDGKVLREWEETVNPKAFMWLTVQHNNRLLCTYGCLLSGAYAVRCNTQKFKQKREMMQCHKGLKCL